MEGWKPNRQILEKITEVTKPKMMVDPSYQGGLETYQTDSESCKDKG